MHEVTPQRACELLVQPPTVILDVREPWEHAICNIAGSQHIPMGEVPSRLHEIERNARIIVLCHHGMRSRQVAEFLERQGYSDVSNLSGGIDAWARVVDPKLATY